MPRTVEFKESEIGTDSISERVKRLPRKRRKPPVIYDGPQRPKKKRKIVPPLKQLFLKDSKEAQRVFDESQRPGAPPLAESALLALKAIEEGNGGKDNTGEKATDDVPQKPMSQPQFPFTVPNSDL